MCTVTEYFSNNPVETIKLFVSNSYIILNKSPQVSVVFKQELKSFETDFQLR